MTEFEKLEARVRRLEELLLPAGPTASGRPFNEGEPVLILASTDQPGRF